MPSKAGDQHSGRTREDPSEGGDQYQVRKPQVFVLEERHDALLAATRALKAAHYKVHTVFEEKRIVAAILAAADGHFLLLTVQDTNRPLAVPQILDALRQSGYDLPATYCVKGKVSAETRSAYEALSMDCVLSLPVATRACVLDALAWLHERVALHDGGTTILEV